MPFNIYVSHCATYSALEKLINFDVKRLPAKKLKAFKKKLFTLKNFQDVTLEAKDCFVAKSETCYWMLDLKEKDPWLVFSFITIPIPEEYEGEIVATDERRKSIAPTPTVVPTEKGFGCFMLSLSITSPRYIRNLTNALYVSLRMAATFEGATVLIPDPLFKNKTNNSELLTEEILKNEIFGGSLAFISEQKAIWAEKLTFICKKNFAPLEYPVGNVDMVREYFVFQIIKIEDKEELLKDMYKAMPNMMRLVGLHIVGESKPIFIPIPHPSRQTSQYTQFMVLDKKTTLPKVSIEWIEKDERLIIQPNYSCRPADMYRGLNWNSLAAATIHTFKGIVERFDIDIATGVLFCGKPLSNILWNKIQKQALSLGVEFHLFWQEYSSGGQEKAKTEKRDLKSPTLK